MSAPRTLVVRLDSDGDVLLAGPAVRAVAAGSARTSLLVSPQGEQAARLLPGVDDVLVWSCPWSGFAPPPVDATSVADVVERVRTLRVDVAVVLTSFHQSALPTALLLRLAGVPWVVGHSTDYPGSLLDVRHPPGGPHEVERGLSLAAAAGLPLPADDDRRLRVRGVPERHGDVGVPDGYVVLHPCASVPARSPSPGVAGRVAAALVAAGRDVVVTGGPADTATGAVVTAAARAAGHAPAVDGSGGRCVDLTGRTRFDELAVVLRDAACVVAPNTGPAHLAAAVGTPVVSLFAPVVDPAAWHPWGVPVRLLGDVTAPCAASRARTCPVPGHPCLDGLDPADVVRAVDALAPLGDRDVLLEDVVPA
ncbi:glycosyltransferase family 9 protein [Aquipuribacter nitratireducens]|uniref:Glycosyltransferase family 9 protein n=1 Tax=Aquipuribacter nitratireducens TaxID=650104 RepID=A0ABW0GNN6_9MICO